MTDDLWTGILKPGNPSQFQTGIFVATTDTDLTACAMTEPIDAAFEVGANVAYQMDYNCDGIVPVCDATECDEDQPGAAWARAYQGGQLVTNERATGGAIALTYFTGYCQIEVDIAFADGGRLMANIVLNHDNDLMCDELSWAP